MRNPPPLNLQKDLQPQEEIQYYRYSLNAEKNMAKWSQNKSRRLARHLQRKRLIDRLIKGERIQLMLNARKKSSLSTV